MEYKEYFDKFLAIGPMICFVIVLIVQLKIIRALRDQQSLTIFYGKQIEEIRKMSSGAGYPRRLPDVPADETGLYEVLKE